jgi:hypothetical protein
MNGRYGRALAALLLASQGAWASAQDVSGIACAGGELTVVTGEAFSARCTGDLRIAASSVIEAEASITLVADGNLWMTGTLSAPVIHLFAYQNAYPADGGAFAEPARFSQPKQLIFSAGTLSVAGSEVFFPPASGFVGSLTVRDPAATVVWTPAVLEATSPVPEPATPLMFGLGAALLAWKRARMSRSAHRTGNPNVKLEN